MDDNLNLKKLIDKFSNLKVSVIGDLMLDEYTWGSVDRVSPEAPVLVVKVNRKSFRAGGAGNVAANLAGLGATVKLTSVVGDDREATVLKEILKKNKVSIDCLLSSTSVPTITKNRVIAHNQQVVRVDRESSAEYEKDLKDSIVQKIKLATADTDVVIVSDYGKGVFSKQISNALFDILKEKKRVPVVIDPKPNQISLYSGSSIITPNRLEAEIISDMKITNIEDGLKASKVIFSKIVVDEILLTLGENGMALFNKDIGLVDQIDTVAKKVFDVSGAGDTVCSLLALGIAAGASSLDAAKLSNIAAGIVVGEVGTVPITKEKLLDDLNKSSTQGLSADIQNLKIANA